MEDDMVPVWDYGVGGEWSWVPRSSDSLGLDLFVLRDAVVEHRVRGLY